MSTLFLIALITAPMPPVPVLVKRHGKSCNVYSTQDSYEIECVEIMDFRSSDEKDKRTYTGMRRCVLGRPEHCIFKMIDWKY